MAVIHSNNISEMYSISGLCVLCKFHFLVSEDYHAFPFKHLWAPNAIILFIDAMLASFYILPTNGDIAQLVERRVRNA